MFLHLHLFESMMIGSSIFSDHEKYAEPEPGPSNQFEMKMKENGFDTSVLNEKE